MSKQDFEQAERDGGDGRITALIELLNLAQGEHDKLKRQGRGDYYFDGAANEVRDLFGIPRA